MRAVGAPGTPGAPGAGGAAGAGGAGGAAGAGGAGGAAGGAGGSAGAGGAGGDAQADGAVRNSRRRVVDPLIAQTGAEVRMTLRRGESVLLTLAIPVGLLVFFSLVDVLPKPAGVRHAVQFLAPGVLALAVMSTAMVGLAIATGFERQYGVLKRLRATPLGRPALLAAKILAILAVEVLQVGVLVGVALALGWDPAGVPALAVPAIALATVGFAGLGLLMAGALRAEVTLAAANGLYLVMLLLGGMIFPLTSLPSGMRSVARLLPSGALSDALHGAFSAGASVPGRAWLVLTLWALLAPAAAAVTFRWE